MSRVLQVVPTLATGGAETVVLHLSTELTKLGVETRVVSLFCNGGSQLERAVHAAGIEVSSLGKQLGLDIRMILRLRHLIRNSRPDLIHTHLSALKYVVASVTGLGQRPRIVHTMHRLADRDFEPGLRWLQRYCLGRNVKLVAVSEQVANSCSRVYARDDVSVVPNGIPVQRYGRVQKERARARQLLGFADDWFIYSCVARLSPVKNQPALIEAFSGIAHSGAHLVLAGDGAMRSTLEALTRTLGLQQRTHFLGERDDVYTVLAAADAFVLPSLSEGNPVSLLEAMAAGLPIVATAVGGIPELVRGGTDGVLVPPGNINALRDAMVNIAFNSDMRKSLSLAARDRARTCFDARIMAQSYIGIYEQLGMTYTR